MIIVKISLVIWTLMTIWVLFIEKPNSKINTIWGSIICFLGAIIWFCFANAPIVHPHGRDVSSYWHECLLEQRIISEAINDYNKEQNTPFPLNVDKSDFDKQIDLLINNDYIRGNFKKILHDLSSRCNCSYEIKEGELFCSVHGSRDEKSPKYDKEMANRKKELDERTKFNNFIYDYSSLMFALSFLSLLTSIKFLIFNFKIKNSRKN